MKNGERVEYRCDTYHRYGKEHCTAHTVEEETLDCLDLGKTGTCPAKRRIKDNWNAMEHLIDQWRPKASTAAARIESWPSGWRCWRTRWR